MKMKIKVKDDEGDTKFAIETPRKGFDWTFQVARRHDKKTLFNFWKMKILLSKSIKLFILSGMIILFQINEVLVWYKNPFPI